MSAFDKLGLAMIPSGYKGEADPNNAGGYLGKVYSVLPAQTTSNDLVTNGGFDTDSDWLLTAAGGTTIIANGVAEFPDTTTSYLIQSNVAEEVIKTYILTYTVKSSNNTGLRLAGGASAFGNTTIPNTVGTHTLTLTSNGTQRNLQFNNQGFVGTIDDVSLIKVIDGDFSFSRGSIATRVNSQGLIESVQASGVDDTDIPRLDYSDGSCPALLLEPSRTNKITQSENFGSSVWNTNTGSVTVESGYLAPDGTNTAYKITEVSSGVFFTGSLNILGTDARSIFARTVSGTGQVSLLTNQANNDNLFTLTEEWQRFEITSASIAGSTFYGVDFRNANATLTEVIIWGAQSEVGSYVTSYIPTSGQQETRLADKCNNAGDSTIFNDDEGVLFVEAASLESTGGIISLNDGTGTNDRNSVRLFFISGEIRAQIYNSDGSINVSISTSGANVLNFNKVALKYSQSVCSLFVNGVKIGDDTDSFSVSSLSKINFARNNPDSIVYKGKVKALHYFNEALSDQECIDLTT